MARTSSTWTWGRRAKAPQRKSGCQEQWPCEINGMRLQNRFVRSATWEGMAGEKGECTPKITNIMTELTEGDVGRIISMSRPFIREPALIKRWASGDLRKAKCLSDNFCFKPAMEGKGIYCVVDKRLKEKK